MRARLFVLGLIAAAATAPGCYLSHERPGAPAAREDGSVERDGGRPSGLLWVLVHPTTAPLGPGTFLFDEESQAIVRRLDLPPGAASPHALAWDGRSLWLGCAWPARIFELDPETGAVRSTIEGLAIEGIAAAPDGTLWYAGRPDGTASLRVANVTRAGEELEALFVPEATLQDLVLADGTLYYLVNDGLDRVVRLTTSGASMDLTRVVPSSAPYSLGFDGTYLAVAADQTIHRFDRSTGALVRSDPLAVPGWITAIAFVR